MLGLECGQSNMCCIVMGGQGKIGQMTSLCWASGCCNNNNP